MERLVTLADLEQRPELISKGISVNQYYNFDLLKSSSATPAAQPLPPEAAEVAPQKMEEKIKEATKPPTKSKATTTIQQPKPIKQKAKSK